MTSPSTGRRSSPSPPPPPPPAIDTRITKVKLYKAKQGKSGSAKKRVARKGGKAKGQAAKAKFTFTGSGGSGKLSFECRLDRGAFKPCHSPQFYKGLKLGEHKFEVRALDATGATDPTPATFAFKAKAGKTGRTK